MWKTITRIPAIWHIIMELIDIVLSVVQVSNSCNSVFENEIERLKQLKKDVIKAVDLIEGRIGKT